MIKLEQWTKAPDRVGYWWYTADEDDSICIHWLDYDDDRFVVGYDDGSTAPLSEFPGLWHRVRGPRNDPTEEDWEAAK